MPLSTPANQELGRRAAPRRRGWLRQSLLLLLAMGCGALLAGRMQVAIASPSSLKLLETGDLDQNARQDL